MGSLPSRQQDLFQPRLRMEALPAGVQTRLRPLLLALLTEAAVKDAMTRQPCEEIGDE